jgi:hypothetical protein
MQCPKKLDGKIMLQKNPIDGFRQCFFH